MNIIASCFKHEEPRHDYPLVVASLVSPAVKLAARHIISLHAGVARVNNLHGSIEGFQPIRVQQVDVSARKLWLIGQLDRAGPL